MKNKIAIISIPVLLLIFHFLNGKYLILAPIIYTISYIYNQNSKKKFDKKDLLFGIIFIALEVFILKKVLNEYITNIKIKNVFSAIEIITYTYIFADKDLTIKLFKKFEQAFSKMSKKWNNLISNKKIFWILPDNLIIFICLLLSIYTIISFSNKAVDDYYYVYSQSKRDEYIEILKETKLNLNLENFTDKDNTFSHICIPFGTFERTNNTKLEFKIIKGKKTIAKKTIKTNRLKNGETKCFNTKGLTLEQLKKSNIILSPDSKTKRGNSIAIFKNKKTNETAYSLAKVQNSNIYNIKKILIISSLIIFSSINYLINSKKINYNKFYIYCVLYIIPLVFIIPAYTVPDEPHHFYRAYANSQIIDDNFNFKGFNNYKNKVPKNIKCLNYAKINTANKVLDINDIKNCAKEGKNTTIYNNDAGMSPFFGYIPQTIGLKIADIFTNSPLYIFYFGRLFTALTTIFIVYMSIKITPKYKSLFLIVGTMLMFIQQMISYSYDSILNGMALLFMAYMIKFINDKNKIKLKDFIIPLICYSIIIDIKAVYIPIGIMLFFIPKNKFDKNKYLYIFTFFLTTFTSLKIIDILVSLGTNNAITETIITSKASKQLAFIIKNPLYITKIIYKTMEHNFMFYIRSLVGYFGWFTFKINDTYIIAYLALITYTILSEKNILNTKNRIILLLCIICSITSIFGAMYLLWTEYKALVVDGVQGRYLIPLLIPFMLCLIPKKEKYKIDKKIVYFSINIILLQFILTMIIWYY